MDGTASLSMTRHTICGLEAPQDWAAVMSSGSTSLRAFWMMRPMKGAAATVSGTRAAVSPIEVPTMSLVSGMIVMSRMMNGNDRMVLTTTSRMPCTTAFSQSPPLSLTASAMPMKKPMTVPKSPARKTILSVARSAGPISTSKS